MSVVQSIEGIWQPVYAELDGEEAPRIALEKMELDLSNGEYTVRFGGENHDHGTYAVNAAEITLHGIAGSNAGRIIPAIFKLVDGMLSVCYGLGGARPTKFSTGPGQQRYLMNYQRKNA